MAWLESLPPAVRPVAIVEYPVEPAFGPVLGWDHIRVYDGS